MKSGDYGSQPVPLNLGLRGHLHSHLPLVPPSLLMARASRVMGYARSSSALFSHADRYHASERLATSRKI